MSPPTALMDGFQRFDALEPVLQSPPFRPQFVVHLEIHPELGGSTEVPGEPDGRAGCDPALAVHDLVDPARRHPDSDGEAGGCVRSAANDNTSATMATPTVPTAPEIVAIFVQS